MQCQWGDGVGQKEGRHRGVQREVEGQQTGAPCSGSGERERKNDMQIERQGRKIKSAQH